jgi:hypothetical protein
MVDEEREELHRRVMLLKEYIESGKIIFAEHLVEEFFQKMKQIRFDEDGLVIPESVDGIIRSSSSFIAYMEMRNNLKSVASVLDVQQAYFTNIENVFGDFYKKMKEYKTNPHNFARALSRDEDYVNKVLPFIPEFLDKVIEFWSGVGDCVRYHVEDTQALKAVFGGDLFPSQNMNIASTCGLYFDSIILPDPFMQSVKLFPFWDKNSQVYYFIKHGLNALSYKSLSLTDFDLPVVVILPTKYGFDENYTKYLHNITEIDALKYAGALFGHKFGSVDELDKFANNLETPDDVIKSVTDTQLLLFDTEWSNPLHEQIIQYMKKHLFGVTHHPGKAIIGHCFGRMGQANDLLRKSFELKGTPLIDAETSWRYFNWKMHFDAISETSNLIPLHVMRGLQTSAEGEMHWIGNIPPSALIEMKRQGAILEIREILSQGIAEIIAADPMNFFDTTEKVMVNIESAFKEHEKQLNRIRNEKLKYFGIDVTSFLTVGGISIAAAIIAHPVIGALSAGIGLLGVPTLRDLHHSFKELQDKSKEARSSPVGLFFKHKKI